MMRMFSPWILGTCLITLNLVFVALAALMGWLPAILSFLSRLLRTTLVWSYHIYRQVLTWIDPLSEDWFGTKLSVGFPRMVACLALSLLIVSLLFALTPLDFSWWSLGLAGLHGLALGYLWGDVLEPGGLHLGSRLP